MSEYFEGMTDPRQEAKVKHSFIDTIMIVICAVIAGCDVWEDIADYCRVKEAWFREALGLELANGIPSHDTMERIFAMLNPKEFQERFIAWVQHACGKQSREIISVDGKTMRGSGSEEHKPIHMLSAWANKAKAVFGQMSIDGKPNEIAAVPELLELLDIEGTIRSSCQHGHSVELETPGAVGEKVLEWSRSFSPLLSAQLPVGNCLTPVSARPLARRLCRTGVSVNGNIYQTALPELMTVSYPGIVNWI